MKTSRTLGRTPKNAISNIFSIAIIIYIKTSLSVSYENVFVPGKETALLSLRFLNFLIYWLVIGVLYKVDQRCQGAVRGV